MATKSPPKKRVTIASLKKEIKELESRVQQEMTAREEEHERRMKMQSEVSEANQSMREAVAERIKAERHLHDCRRGMLEYFQCKADPQTASDKHRIERIQSIISGMMLASNDNPNSIAEPRSQRSW